ncbi:sigma 54-interacting transcriptional regulator [Bombilactobacillus thymidiniphilus]|uniref:Sigma 54-interacting transcriptional regulator n=1 Tax=Bombilactobacillus thymidiniphilus TaxID=2923363 RepID=A0ABY4PF45_9LACO|nr:sigma 54-interacting transcriptional regulator [Bombilactobacillus thymidiniphilus]UQS84195.1 sigma 54-interacting transcriptional regulator [Bombilactobacillus thymidiniphilus]
MLKEQIAAAVKKNTVAAQKKYQVLDTQALGRQMKVKRNTISHYLNVLWREQKLIKVNSRPVIFWDRQVLEDTYHVSLQAEYVSQQALQAILQTASSRDNAVLDHIIGSQGSLYVPLERLKAAAGYPDTGLPMLITGSTGSGKSFLARAYYDYCVEQGYLSDTARFLQLNCAEYADNPELLTSNLFGYRQGAFTGATQNKTGLFDEADGGVLFLDEIHRLNAKGQEKLFRYLDTGLISPLGETKNSQKVRVRLVFATTENLDSYFLDTFLRRVPIQITLPPLKDRNDSEIASLVKLFYLRQSQKIKKTITVDQTVVRILKTNNYSHNVGELKNAVIISVANALQRGEDKAQLAVNVVDLPSDILQTVTLLPDIRSKQLVITPQATLQQLIGAKQPANNVIQKTINSWLQVYQTTNNSADFWSNCLGVLNHLCDDLMFKSATQVCPLPLSFYKNFFQGELKQIALQNHLRVNGNMAMLLSYYFYRRQTAMVELSPKQQQICQKLVTHFQQTDPKLWAIVTEMHNLIVQNTKLQNSMADQLFLYFYLHDKMQEIPRQTLRCIVLAHGYSTASSIADVANELTGEHLLDALDMPIDIQVPEIGRKVDNYAHSLTQVTGLIALVDMGSLADIKKYLQPDLTFPIAVMTNVSTQSALVTAQSIQNQLPLQDIMEAVSQQVVTTKQVIYPPTIKKNLIITCCLTGIGTANKIRQLLMASLPEDSDLEVQSFEYSHLKDSSQLAFLQQIYNIVFVIGTIDPEVKEVKYYPLETIISGTNAAALKNLLANYLTKAQLAEFNKHLIRNFTLERVINSLTILDANIVMQNIDLALERYTKLSQQELSNMTRMSLYVHVSCLIERVVRNEPITTYDMHQISDTNQKITLKNIQKAFSVIEDCYSVKIPLAEYGYIYDIIVAN